MLIQDTTNSIVDSEEDDKPPIPINSFDILNAHSHDRSIHHHKLDSDEELDELLSSNHLSTKDSLPQTSTSPSSVPIRQNMTSKWKTDATTTGGMSRIESRLFIREMLTQTLPIMLISLLGAVFTGELLLTLQTWRVFIRVEELFILIPILLNLKGNLEMNLASRFSTSANIGELDSRQIRRSLIYGNLALLQVQALLVSLLSGLLSFILGILSRSGIHHALQHPIHSAAGSSGITDALRGGYFEVLLVLCVAMLAAGLSSAVLGAFMCSLVVLSRSRKINPDNFATPLAAGLGDLLTLTILGVVSSMFAKVMGTFVSTGVVILLFGVIGFNIIITLRNTYVQGLLMVGWGPLILAMVISSVTGLVLERSVSLYPTFALYSPIVTSLAGSSGSIFVSRISTALHSNGKEHYAIVAMWLGGITWSVMALVLLVSGVIGEGEMMTGAWIAGYLISSAASVLVSLLVAYYLTLLLWKWDYDPDVYALPLHSSFVDCVAQLLLLGVYISADWFDKRGLSATGMIGEGGAR